MSQYFFGLGNGRPKKKIRKIARKVARKHDAVVVFTSKEGLPGDNGPRYWFYCHNRGTPFDEATANAVTDELNERGLFISALSTGFFK